MKLSAKRVTCFISGCFLPLLTFSQNNFPSLTDTAAKAEIFAPGVVSTPYTEWATSFTPDGKTVYFSQGAIYWTIVSSTLKNGKWMKPQVASFSGRWRDTDPFVSPDGKKLFFISNRPLENTSKDKTPQANHIWYVDQVSANEWGTPHHIDAPVNLDGTGNYAASVSLKGTFYFCSRDREGHSGMTSYYAEWLNDHYGKPRMISFSGLNETQDPFIAPDERYLILLSGNDLYISFHQDNDWSAPQKLAPEINNGDSNSSPYVSPDGKTLYYSSSRIKGFYKRDAQSHAVNYDELIKENESLFNSQPNILMIPIHLPFIRHS